MDKWMNNNNFNKILALAFGVMLWAMVHVDTAPSGQTAVNHTQSKIIENVKIEVTGFDEDKYVLTSQDVDSVRLEVRGKNSDINFKYSDAYKVTLDLSKVEPGDNTLPLHYSLPRGVTLETMTPDEVNVHVELRNTKSFPITLLTKGEPAAGYQLGTPVIQPTGTAEVTLPDSDLSKVAKVQGTIELDGEMETFREKRMKLYAYDSRGNEIKDAVIEPAAVSVEIPITLPYKAVPLDIGFTGKLPPSLVLSRVTPEQETVTLYGNKEALETITSYEAVVDLSTIEAAGTVQLKLNLPVPEGLEKVEPGKVNVTVSTSEIAERKVEGIPVTLEGVRQGLKAVITEPASKTLALTLSGAPTLLDQLDEDSVKVVADLSGLAAGTHEVALQVSLPQFVSLANAGEQLSVTVNLQAPAASETPGATAPSSTGTPEPSAEPVTGEEEEVVPEPTHAHNDGKIPDPATPAPSEGVAGNNDASSGGTVNEGNAGGSGGA